MGQIKLFSLAILALFFLVSCGGKGAPPPGTGNLRVTVKDSASGASLSGVTVRIGDRAAVTGSDGALQFNGVDEGNLPATLVKGGYKSQTKSVQITKDATTDQLFQLESQTGGTDYDVLIVGAGSSGVSAAIQAARLGVRVALVEETDWIGGQMTSAAVTSMDSYFNANRSGLYLEFINKVREYYSARGKSVGTCYFSSGFIAFEPAVGQKILYQMLQNAAPLPGASGNAAGIDLYLRSRVDTVASAGNTLTGAVLHDGSLLNSRIIIDATEYGDVLPLTPARYRAGNSTSDALNNDACLNPITYTAVIRKYLNGIAPLLPGKPPEYDLLGDPFHKYITPNGYGFFVNNPDPYNFNFAVHNAWRGMPDSLNPGDYDASSSSYQLITKTGVNNFSNDHGVNVRYLEDRAYRKTKNCEAKLKTLQFIYFSQSALGQTDWSVATDEGFNSPYNDSENQCDNIPAEFKAIERHFPVIPYVRESRRVIGIKNLAAADIKRDGKRAAVNFPSSLAVGDYPFDLHGCSQDSALDSGDRSSDISTDWNTAGGLFQIPFEAFIPEKVDGFLVAEKNLSVSRLVHSAIRLQPITMMTGQAAGALAAISVKQGKQPRNVKPMDVQLALLDAGCLLSRYQYPDVPVSHPLWKMIQLATVYNVMESHDGDLFGADLALSANELDAILSRTFPTENSVIPSDSAISRADLAVELARAMGLQATSAQTPPIFADVPPTHPAYASVQALQPYGVIPPCSSDAKNFCPESHIPRGEAAAYIMNAVLASGITPLSYQPVVAGDSLPPSGSIVINNGSELAASTSVTLTLAATDDSGTVAQMQFSKDGKNWFPWEPFKTSRAATLVGGDGINTIYVRFRDDSGNISQAYSDTISLDTTLPSGSVVINGGAETTASTAVTLSLAASGSAGPVTSMQCSKDGKNWYPWEPFVTSRAVTLVNGAGVNTVYVRFRDGLGKVSPVYSDSITLAL